MHTVQPLGAPLPPPDYVRAPAAGFDRHCVKPLGPDQLERVLEELRTSAA